MPSPSDFPTRGKVTAVQDGQLTFVPRDTTYELFLKTAKPYTGPVNAPVDALIRLSARKVYTVPSGGNFITPIFGPPKIVQGRVRYLDDRYVVVQAGAKVIVELPGGDSAIDLEDGYITLNKMVNVVAFPGATFELMSGVDQIVAVANQQQ
jgi:hypothetical protein